MNEKDYLKDLAPHLFREDLEKEREVPDGYFEDVEERVLAKVRSKEREPEKGKIRRLINYRSVAIAAGLALILALVPYLMQKEEAAEIAKEVDFEKVEEEAATLYIAEEYDMDEIFFSELTEDIPEEVYLSEEGLDDEVLMEYLMENDISETLILESL